MKSIHLTGVKKKIPESPKCTMRNSYVGCELLKKFAKFLRPKFQITSPRLLEPLTLFHDFMPQDTKTINSFLFFGIWDLEFGTWNLGHGIWDLEFETWNLRPGSSKNISC